MTVSQAKNYVANASSRMMDMTDADVINPIAWDMDPLYARFAEHQARIALNCLTQKHSEVEQRLASLLLARLFVNETLAFALLNKKKDRDRHFAE